MNKNKPSAFPPTVNATWNEIPTSEKTTTGTTAYEEQLLADAAKIDSAADAQNVANPLDQVIAGEAPVAPPAPTPVADPAIQESLKLLVTMGTALMSDAYHWGDPGDQWRAEVSKLGALVFDRYLPNFIADQGEIVALAILIGTYAGSNLVKTKTPAGSDGHPRPAGIGKEHFIVTDAPGPRSSNFGHS